MPRQLHVPGPDRLTPYADPDSYVDPDERVSADRHPDIDSNSDPDHDPDPDTDHEPWRVCDKRHVFEFAPRR